MIFITSKYVPLPCLTSSTEVPEGSSCLDAPPCFKHPEKCQFPTGTHQVNDNIQLCSQLTRFIHRLMTACFHFNQRTNRPFIIMAGFFSYHILCKVPSVTYIYHLLAPYYNFCNIYLDFLQLKDSCMLVLPFLSSLSIGSSECSPVAVCLLQPHT